MTVTKPTPTVLAIALGLSFILGINVGRLTVKPAPQKVQKKARPSKPEKQKPAVAAIDQQVLSNDNRELILASSSSDYESLARKAAQSLNPAQQEHMLSVLIAQWAEIDPEKALSFASELNRSDLHAIALQEAAKHFGATTFDLMKQYIADESLHEYLSISIYLGMAATNPQEALQLVEQLPQGNEKNNALYAVMDEWVRQDVQAVFNWLETAEVTPQLHNVYHTAMSQYISTNPDQAAAVITEMQPCSLKSELAVQIAGVMGEKDIDQAIEWISGLDEEARKHALLNAVNIWAGGSDPEAALNYVTSNNPESSDYDDLFSTVAVGLSYNKPDTLLDAIPTLTEKDQMVAAERLAIAFSSMQQERAVGLLDQLPKGLVRDAALQPIISSYQHTDPTKAFQLSEQFSANHKRLEVMGTTLLEWAKTDYTSALNALNASDALSEEGMKTLRLRFQHNSKVNDYVLP